MPRPGPRPYECIRRAWHSDSHQPLRGSLIQEIFRVVNELHSISTRRKKEWQEKLPTVVLRAEEILYSKANSENEYMDVKTLRSRLEDAVNTMIRREDNDESGPFLEPCVEAALSLGCPPRKTPRGQRQGVHRLCTNPGRRNNPAALNPGAMIPEGGGAMIPEGSKPSNGSSNANHLSFPPTNVGVMQEAVPNPPYSAAGAPVFSRTGSGQTSIFCASAPPLFSSVEAPPLIGVHYSSDAHVTPLAGVSFSTRVDESPQTVVGAPTLTNPCLPGFLRALELGRQGSFSSSGSADSFRQTQPSVAQDARMVKGVQAFATTGARMDAGLMGLNLQWPFCSPSTSSSITSSPSCLPQLWCSEGLREQTTRIRMDPDVCTGTGRCETSESWPHFPVDTQLQVLAPYSVLGEDRSSRASILGAGTICSPPSCRPITIEYDKPSCSSEVSCLEADDLQLRLGPPRHLSGKAHKLNVGDDRLEEHGPLSSSASRERSSQHTRVVTNSAEPLNTYVSSGQKSVTGSCWNNSVDPPCSYRQEVPSVHFSSQNAALDSDMPAAKRLRGEVGFTICSSSCEDRLQRGAGFPPSTQFIWPRW